MSNICCLGDSEFTEEVVPNVSRSVDFLRDYIPNQNDPITFVGIYIHVFNTDSGQGFFSGHSGNRALREAFDRINMTYANREISDLSPTCSLIANIEQGIDSRIRFEILGIEEYNDSALSGLPWGLSNAAIDQPLHDAVAARNPIYADTLNLYVTGQPQNVAGAGYATMPTSNMSQRQYMRTWVGGATPGGGDYALDWWRKHWSHELGHVLGLRHTYNGYYTTQNHPFYLEDVHGCGSAADTDFPAPANNNVMGGLDSITLTTLQIARMHYALQAENPSRYASRGVPHGDCIAFSAGLLRPDGQTAQGGHTSDGGAATVLFENITANQGACWDGEFFYVPRDGIYRLSVNFQKDSSPGTYTPKTIWMHLLRNQWEILSTTWSEAADAATGWSPGEESFGRRDSVSTTLMSRLYQGDRLHVTVDSDNGERLRLPDAQFTGELVCSF